MKMPTLEELRAVADKYPVDPAQIRAALARVHPSWTLAQKSGDGAVFVRGTLQVFMSVALYDDGNLWLHVSACGRTGPKAYYLPTWEEMKRVKNDFIGEDRWAYQVLPPLTEYVNLNAFVLHLFARFAGESALPDFTRGLGVL